MGKIPLVAEFEDQLYDDFAFWPKTTVVWEKFHILAVKQRLGEIPPVVDFGDQLYGNFVFWRFGPKLPLFAKSSIFQRRYRDRAKCHWLWILRISYMSTLYFGGLAQNYRWFRKVSYFSSKIGIGQNSTGCGIRGSAIWRLCILTFRPQTTVVCEKFHILAVK